LISACRTTLKIQSGLLNIEQSLRDTDVMISSSSRGCIRIDWHLKIAIVTEAALPHRAAHLGGGEF